MDLIKLTKTLIDIPSVTGSEGRLADFLADYLQAQSFKVRLQKIEGERRNLFATSEEIPRIILCTHMDTVPGFFRAAEDGSYIYGRGACDAKGIMASMIAAAVALKDEGLKKIGLLFVVGEEGDSVGAKKAGELRPESAFIIVGEPTGNKLGAGHKGLLVLRLEAKGRRAHSACPEGGESAVDKLLDALQDIRGLDLGQDPVLGPNTLNIGTIEGGTAYNIIPDRAAASISIRAAVATDILLRKVRGAIAGRLEIEITGRVEPQILTTLPGFEQTVLSFGSDVPYLRPFGRPLLIGPGSIQDAHTDDEKVGKKELAEAVERYKDIVRTLLKETQEENP